MAKASLVAQLLAIVDQAYDHRSWHGTNLRGSIRGLSPADARWRPAPGRHNIWELVVHAAYWKYAVRRRLLKERRGSFAIKGSNWFARPEEQSDRAWRADIVLLHKEHRALREVIAGLSDRDVLKHARGGGTSTFALVSGIAAHDLYHAGQIAILRKVLAR